MINVIGITFGEYIEKTNTFTNTCHQVTTDSEGAVTA